MDGRNLEVFKRLAHPVPGYDRDDVVMGIDPSLTNTGIAVMRGGLCRLFSIGWGAEVGSVHRLAKFREEVNGILARYRPKAVALEGYSFASKFSRSHSLGELGGVLKLCLMDAKVPMIICPPTTLKQYVRGVGKGTKADVIKDAKKRWGFRSSQNDEIDAGALAFVCAEVQYSLGTEHSRVLFTNAKGKGGVEVFLWD